MTDQGKATPKNEALPSTRGEVLLEDLNGPAETTRAPKQVFSAARLPDGLEKTTMLGKGAIATAIRRALGSDDSGGERPDEISRADCKYHEEIGSTDCHAGKRLRS